MPEAKSLFLLPLLRGQQCGSPEMYPKPLQRFCTLPRLDPCIARFGHPSCCIPLAIRRRKRQLFQGIGNGGILLLMKRILPINCRFTLMRALVSQRPHQHNTDAPAIPASIALQIQARCCKYGLILIADYKRCQAFCHMFVTSCHRSMTHDKVQTVILLSICERENVRAMYGSPIWNMEWRFDVHRTIRGCPPNHLF